MTGQHWEIVDVVSGDFRRNCMRGLLESQEASLVQLSQEGAGRAYGLSVGALGEAHYIRPHDSKDLAQQVLKDYYEGKFISEDEDESQIANRGNPD